MSDRETPASRPRRGRRPGSGSTREVILAGARARFATEGFAGTTIRSIAADAQVDPSQVMQFFGSKEQLFAAAMAMPAAVLERLDRAFDGPAEHLGERVVREFLKSWEGNPEESEPLLATLRGAVVNEQASSALSEFIQSRLLSAARGRGEDATLRAGLAAAALVGVITSRRIIGVPSIVNADTEHIVSVLAPAIQNILTGSATP